MKNKKGGFTLIELLAVLVLLGVLVGIVLFQASRTITKSNSAYYKSQESLILLAAKEYFTDYRSLLPKELEEKAEVKVATLVDELYIDEIYDVNQNRCDTINSKVIVTMKNPQEYDYHVHLVCPRTNYETVSD